MGFDCDYDRKIGTVGSDLVEKNDLNLEEIT